MAPAGDWLADAELGAAAAIDPETALVDTPCVAANAGRAADLADELDITAVADVAPVSFAIVGRAGDELRLSVRRCAVGAADGEVGAATAVDPEAALVDTPRAAADAG